MRNGGWIYIENMNQNAGEGIFSSYVFLNDEKNKLFFSKEHPDSFVRYGKYEMRLRDKILVENNEVVKAKVKWYGLGSYAYPYLWKANKTDSQYQESWDDPKLQKNERVNQSKNSLLFQRGIEGKRYRYPYSTRL